jgi:adenylosuccinate lyase
LIERYTLPRMGAIWTDENKFQKWLEVELCVCEVQADLGLIPAEAVEQIRTKAQFNIQRVLEIEQEVKHDVIAFLTNVGEYVGEASRYIRRSHGVHAEPTTFGLKLAVWYDEVGRHIERLKNAQKNISVGKISGAVGTFSHLDPIIEERVCKKLGLAPAPVSTQVVQRDRYAQYLTTLALIGSSLEKFATEIRNLQRTEILEVEEFFSKGQKGSSSMPHKRNPVTCEQIAGLSRVVRANSLASMENIALWHERDITHSSVERIIIPDSLILIDYMLNKMTLIMENLLVYPENMKTNLEKTGGLIFSQSVLLALTQKGMSREKAYQLVQQCAMEVWKTKKLFKALLLGQPEIMNSLSPQELENCFDLKIHLRNVERIFERVGILTE